MKVSRIKIILIILLATACVIAFGWLVMMQNHATLVRNHAEDESLKLEEVSRILDEIESSWKDMEQRIREQFEVDVTLSALTLGKIISEKGDEAIARYSNGAVIKIEGDEVIGPKGVDQTSGLSADQFGSREGLFALPGNPETLIVYSRISVPYYYV